MSVEIITFKKLGFFSRLLGLFFLLKYSFRRAMLQLEFGESKPEESQSEQCITETRKAASCSSETLKSNAGSGPAAAGCPVSNPDNLWKSPLLADWWLFEWHNTACGSTTSFFESPAYCNFASWKIGGIKKQERPFNKTPCLLGNSPIF